MVSLGRIKVLSLVMIDHGQKCGNVLDNMEGKISVMFVYVCVVA